VNHRLLGIIAMICAPAMLVGQLLQEGQEDALISGIASMVFMAGWICSNTAMRRRRATGTGKWGRGVLVVQLVGLVLAFLFGLFEATGVLDRESTIFNITDVAWPLSMLWIVVVGVTVIVAKRLSGWRRFVPLLCPCWLPIVLVTSVVLGDMLGGLIGFGIAAVLWMLLGYVVSSADRQTALTPPPEPAVQ
jgi:hypothetical protein